MWNDILLTKEVYEMAKESFVKSAKKIFQVLEELAKNGGRMKLKDISNNLGFPPSTVHRLLHTLTELGYVDQDTKSSDYIIGVKVLSLAASSLGGIDLGNIAFNYLVKLRDATGETANLAVMDGNESLYIQKVESRAMVRVFSLIGKRAPLHATGVGKIMMSDKSWFEVQEILEETGIPKITKFTIDSMEEMKDELETIRARGYAYDNEECELGAFCVAAPVRDYTGRVIASMSVSMPTNRFSKATKEKLIGEVLKQSRALSNKLGYEE